MAEEAKEEPVRIVLTPEQREIVHRLSGQTMEAIELTPEEAKEGGGLLRVFWRLSSASGIPRQKFDFLDEGKKKAKK
jgi:hypothetical protein